MQGAPSAVPREKKCVFRPRESSLEVLVISLQRLFAHVREFINEVAQPRHDGQDLEVSEKPRM